MARGYLGKISAVISANNGEYIRALDQSKQATRNFASTVTRDLRAATRDASKSLEGILTPLQRFDRALKAAVSQRLSFRGFEGAIRTFKDLEKTIGNLSDREVRIALRASGFREIEQLRAAVAGLQQTDVDLFVNLVGKDATTNDLRRLIATANQADGKVIGLKAQVNVAEAQRLIETFESRGIASTRRIRRAIESLNEFRAEGAATALRGIVSVAEQIGRPVAAAAAQLGGLSLEVQAQLVPALARAQDGVGKLERDIDAKLPIAERRFEGVRRAAESAAQAISRAAEASKLAASGATGNELGFVAPRVRNELQANAAARNRVAESADPSRFRSEVQELDRIGQSIERINASIERRRILGLDTAEAERNLSRVLERSQQVRASIRGAQEFSVIPGNAVGEFGPTGAGPSTDVRARLFNQSRLLDEQRRDEQAQRNSARRDQERQSGRARDFFAPAENVQQELQQVAQLSEAYRSLTPAQQQALEPLKDRVNTLANLAEESGGVGLLRNAYEELARAIQEARSADEQRIATAARNQQVSEQLGRTVSNLRDRRRQIERDPAETFAQLPDAAARARTATRTTVGPDQEDLQRRLNGALETLRAVQQEFERLRRSDPTRENAVAWELVERNASDALDVLLAIEAAAQRSAEQTRAAAAAEDQRRAAAVARANREFVATPGNPSGPQGPSLRVDVPVDQLIQSAEQLRAGFVDRIIQIETAWDRAVRGLVGTTDELDQRFFELARTIEGLDIGERVDLDPLIRGYRDAVASGEGYAATLQRLTELEAAVGQAQQRRTAATEAAANAQTNAARRNQAAQSIPDAAAGLEGAFAQEGIGRAQAAIRLLAEAGAQAGGPAAQAYDRLAAAQRRFIAEGIAGTPQARREIQRLERDLAQVVSQTSRISFSRALREIQRGGDIGRRGIGNYSLALNQLAFVFDDFTSTTGGAEQKLRAVQNNLTQIGFILGGTTGLFTALGAAIAGQAAIALVKFLNAGRTTETQLKALNDSLANQKRLIEQIAAAFQSLGATIASRGFAPATAAANEFVQKLEEIVRLQKELAEQRIAETNQGIQNLRTDRQVTQQRLERETDVGQRVALTRRLADIDRAEREATQRVAGGDGAQIEFRNFFRDLFREVDTLRIPAARGQEIADSFIEIADRIERGIESRRGINQTTDALSAGDITRAIGLSGDPARGGSSPELRAAATRLRGLGAQLNLGNDAKALGEQIDAIQEIIDRLSGVAQRTFLGFRTTAANEASQIIRGFEEVQQRLRAQLESSATSKVQQGAIDGADAASRLLDDSQKAAQELIRLGVADAGGLSSDLDALSKAVSDAVKRIEESIRGVDDQGRPVARTPAEVLRINQDQARQIAQARRGADDAAARALELRRLVAVDPQETFDSRIGRAGESLNQAQATQGIIARAIREATFQREQIVGRLETTRDPQERQALLRELDAVNNLAPALEDAALQVSRFAEAITRAEQEVQSDLQSARQREDQARRRDIRLGTAETQEDRGRAERELREQQEAARRAEEVFRLERDRLERDAVGATRDDFRRLGEIDERVAGGGTTRQEREQLERERRLISARIDAAVEASPAVRQARDEFAGVAERQDLARQGRGLLLSPAEREARELGESLAAVSAAFEDEARQAGRAVDADGLRQEQQKLIEASQRRLAPLAFQFADEIANAVLQGPSRAALGATDASTTQGQAELNRLIRGQDSARDVNLVELEKQTQELIKLNEKFNLQVAGA
jgi:hypothetical protein